MAENRCPRKGGIHIRKYISLGSQEHPDHPHLSIPLLAKPAELTTLLAAFVIWTKILLHCRVKGSWVQPLGKHNPVTRQILIPAFIYRNHYCKESLGKSQYQALKTEFLVYSEGIQATLSYKHHNAHNCWLLCCGLTENEPKESPKH